MEKERPSHKWASDETNLSCEILADPVNSFMKTWERGAKKVFSSELFDSIITEFSPYLGGWWVVVVVVGGNSTPLPSLYWFSVNNLETVKAVTLAFCSI